MAKFVCLFDFAIAQFFGFRLDDNLCKFMQSIT